MSQLLTPTRSKIPDPHGLIARIRARLNKKCAVRCSPYCDYIISMRMQAIPFRDIEAWLVKQGDQYRISAPTIWRNFKSCKMEVKLTYAEEMLEKVGGVINLDLVRELSQNIITQKERIDHLVRAEKKVQMEKGRENYSDRRIRQEMQAQNEMIAKLDAILTKAPADVAKKAEEMARSMENQQLTLTEDAKDVLADMILKEEILIGPNDILPEANTRH